MNSSVRGSVQPRRIATLTVDDLQSEAVSRSKSCHLCCGPISGASRRIVASFRRRSPVSTSAGNERFASGSRNMRASSRPPTADRRHFGRVHWMSLTIAQMEHDRKSCDSPSIGFTRNFLYQDRVKMTPYERKQFWAPTGGRRVRPQSVDRISTWPGRPRAFRPSSRFGEFDG
jgi:hypothetical protein